MLHFQMKYEYLPTALQNSSYFFFGHTCSIWKFPGQGLNPCHSSNPSCYSENARSLTSCATREKSNSSNFYETVKNS